MIYQNLVPNFFSEEPVSVHLCNYPVADMGYVDSALEAGMEDVLKIVELGRSARNGSNLKNRQPLAKMLVASERELRLAGELEAVALDELNVKEMVRLAGADDLVSYSLKPQLRTLGPKYGKKLRAITEFLNTCNAKEVVNAVKGGGAYNVDLDGEVVLTEEDLQIFTSSAEGYATAQSYGVTVALDTALTEDLLDEGTERELVSKIQTMRKEAGFEVTDRIAVYHVATGRAKKMLERAAFASDVLAERIEEGPAEGFSKKLDINGDEATLTIVKL